MRDGHFFSHLLSLEPPSSRCAAISYIKQLHLQGSSEIARPRLDKYPKDQDDPNKKTKNPKYSEHTFKTLPIKKTSEFLKVLSSIRYQRGLSSLIKSSYIFELYFEMHPPCNSHATRQIHVDKTNTWFSSKLTCGSRRRGSRIACWMQALASARWQTGRRRRRLSPAKDRFLWKEVFFIICIHCLMSRYSDWKF